MLLTILSAVLGVLALLPLAWSGISFFCLVPLFVFLQKEQSFWKLFLGVFLFRLLFLLGVVSYALEPLTWLFSLGLFVSLAGWVFVCQKIFANYPEASFFYIPLGYALAELFEARYSFLPSYIATAGNMLGSSPFLGLAKYGGLWSLEFFVVLLNGIFWWFLVQRKSFFLEFKFFCLAFLVGIFFLLDSWLGSQFFLQQNVQLNLAKHKQLKIATVSARSDGLEKSKEDLVMLGKVQADLLVLPEEFFAKQDNQAFTLEETTALIRELNLKTDFVLTTFHIFKDSKHYNTAILFAKNGEIIDQYDKNRLTIFGEYWPYAWHPAFYDALKADAKMKDYALFNSNNNYTAGKPKMMQIRGANFATLICLENHYPDFWNFYQKQGVDFFLNPVNSAWLPFGQNQFEYLMSNLNAIQSVQTGLPVVTSGAGSFAGFFASDGKSNKTKSGDFGEFKMLTQEIFY